MILLELATGTLLFYSKDITFGGADFEIPTYKIPPVSSTFCFPPLARCFFRGKQARPAMLEAKRPIQWYQPRTGYVALRSPTKICALFGYLRKENRCAMPYSDFFCGRNTFFSGRRHCAAILFSQVPKKCTDLDLSLLYILILGTYSKFIRKNNFPALGVCFPQPCSSAGRRFAASRSRLKNYRRIVSFPQQKIR